LDFWLETDDSDRATTRKLLPWNPYR
jgi:hypothetical protein